MNIQHFFDPATYTLTYVVWDDSSKDAIIIDPVLDYDQASSAISHDSADQVIQFVQNKGLSLHAILETHAHADHVSGARYIQETFPEAKVLIGENITKVQSTFAKVYNFKDALTDGSQFDGLLKDGSTVSFGSISVGVTNTPGHTPACSSFKIGDVVFTGDALFMPDFGVGRCDFPGGDANALYQSVHEKLYKLPDDTRVFTGHDYQPGGRDLAFESTIGQQKAENVHLKASTSEADFVDFRTKRDAKLKAPRLLLPSIQLNVFGGRLPAPEDNGVRYLKVPLS